MSQNAPAVTSEPGMVSLRGVLDPEAAAVIKSAVDPLSVPCPTKDKHGHTLEPDPRTHATRRADALLEIVARGVAAGDRLPVTDKAKLVVTVEHDVLAGKLRGTGAATGRAGAGGAERGATPAGRVTRADVARYAGVSGAVVSYVVNGGPRPVAPATRERVLHAVRALGYRPNATARALSRGSTGLLGLVGRSVSFEAQAVAGPVGSPVS